jgi:hypothetical protein
MVRPASKEAGGILFKMALPGPIERFPKSLALPESGKADFYREASQPWIFARAMGKPQLGACRICRPEVP